MLGLCYSRYSTYEQPDLFSYLQISIQAELTYNVPVVDPDESFQLNVSVTVKPSETDVNVLDLNRDERSTSEELLDYLTLEDSLEGDPEVGVIEREIEEQVSRHSRQTQTETEANVLPTPTSSPAAEQKQTRLVTEVCFQ